MKKESVDQQLDAALSQAPEFELPDDFPSRVMRKIEQRKLVLDQRANLILWVAALGFILLAAISFVVFLDNAVLVKLFDVSGWAVFIGIMVVIFQVLDQKLVRKKLPGNTV